MSEEITEAENVTEVDATSEEAKSTNYLEGTTFEEGYTPSERVTQFGDVGKLAKGYDSLFEKLQDKGSIRPDKPEDYSWKPPEGMEAHFESLPDMLKTYHEQGLGDKEVSGRLDEQAAGLSAALAGMQNQQAEVAKQTEEALKEKWGDDYADNLKAVNKIAERYPAASDKLKSGGYGNDPDILSMLHDVSMSVRENSPPKAQGGDSKTLEARKAELKLLYNDPTKKRDGSRAQWRSEIDEINKQIASQRG